MMLSSGVPPTVWLLVLVPLGKATACVVVCNVLVKKCHNLFVLFPTHNHVYCSICMYSLKVGSFSGFFQPPCFIPDISACYYQVDDHVSQSGCQRCEWR